MIIIGIIPARMGSSRFWGKPMAKILGIPMIGHVYMKSKKCKTLNEVYVATCDKEIFDYINTLDGKAIMTSDKHQRCTDRIAEALLYIEKDLNCKIDIVVNIQGDEPMIYPEMIDEALKPMIEDVNIVTTNLMAPIKTIEEFNDPNTVKVVVDKKNYALYFSREPIPSLKKGAESVQMSKQVCVIPFRRDFLIKFNDLPSTPLEIAESVDMLRVIEHGYKVKMVMTRYETYSVDTRDDLLKVERIMMKEFEGGKL
ncbi:MAG: 3-deoxy-manno-octulosonate cytidylyltransferase [Candidatus Hydrogenedentota bacterium]